MVSKINKTRKQQQKLNYKTLTKLIQNLQKLFTVDLHRTINLWETLIHRVMVAVYNIQNIKQNKLNCLFFKRQLDMSSTPLCLPLLANKDEYITSDPRDTDSIFKTRVCDFSFTKKRPTTRCNQTEQEVIMQLRRSCALLLRATQAGGL